MPDSQLHLESKTGLGLAKVQNYIFWGGHRTEKLILGGWTPHILCELANNLGGQKTYTEGGGAQGGGIFEISWEPNFPVNNFARNNWKIAPSSTQ